MAGAQTSVSGAMHWQTIGIIQVNRFEGIRSESVGDQSSLSARQFMAAVLGHGQKTCN